MGNIIHLDRQWSGSARCVPCHHQWEFVAPHETDLTRLECPACGAQHSMVMTNGGRAE